MKTEIKIPVRAYSVKIKDERTGEQKNDVIVIEKARLQAAAMVGLCDDEFICRTYNRQGYRVLEIDRPEKVMLTADLHELYYATDLIGEEVPEADMEQRRESITDRELIDLNDGEEGAHD